MSNSDGLDAERRARDERAGHALSEALKTARTTPVDLTVVLTELDGICRTAEAEVERLSADDEAFDGMGNHSNPDYRTWLELAAELQSLVERLRR